MTPILKPGRNCQGLYEVRKTGLLIDGRDYYRALYQTAQKARQHILLAGWQFDSNVLLLRENDPPDENLRFLSFLNHLCEKNSRLQIYILAWDFSVLYAMEREWFQEEIFNQWIGHPGIHFRFDNSHPLGASHHQKFAVLDGAMAFVGGLDICAQRWDDRRHRGDSPHRRDPDGEPYRPFHDIQSYHIGPLAKQLAELFAARWRQATGENLALPPPAEETSWKIRPTIPISLGRVALSQTRPQSIVPLQKSIREIRALYRDAIQAAESLIYMENQYFTSRAVFDAFAERMKRKDKPKLQIVLLLPPHPSAFIEELALESAQSRILHGLKEIASREGHSLGIFFSASNQHKKSIPTYIHSKLLLVDDRFLSVGSANTTNRSMGLDTELNVSWEADEAHGTHRSILRSRRSLLAEHVGIDRLAHCRHLARVDGLVDLLNSLADQPGFRLQRYQVSVSRGSDLFNIIQEDRLTDPEKPMIEENLFELIANDKTGLFATGISYLNAWLGPSAGKSQIPRSLQKSPSFLLVKVLSTILSRRKWVTLFTAIFFTIILWLIFRSP